MKIDYELAGKIGATHYNQAQETYVKIHRGVLQFYDFHSRSWVNTVWDSFHTVKPIHTRPPVRVEYEKVQFEPEEIWKAFKEHQEDGHLFVANKDEYECLGDGVFELAMAISQGDKLYRRIEKTVDWQGEVSEFLKNQDSVESGEIISKELAYQINYLQWDKATKREFLEMCRIALRANGEL